MSWFIIRQAETGHAGFNLHCNDSKGLKTLRKQQNNFALQCCNWTFAFSCNLPFLGRKLDLRVGGGGSALDTLSVLKAEDPIYCAQ